MLLEHISPGEGRDLQARTTQASISLPSHNEVPQMVLLMQQKLIFSQVCKLEVQDQAVDSFEFSRGLCLGLQMAIFLLSSYGLSFGNTPLVFLFVPKLPPLIRTSTHTE